MRKRLFEVMPGPLAEAMLRFRRRFGSGTNVGFYHELQRIHAAVENAADLPDGCALEPADAMFAMDERLHTYPQPIWLMRPHG